MKNIFLIFVFVFSALVGVAQKEYQIKGEIDNLKDGDVFLVRATEDGRADTVLVSKAKNGKFTFSGNLFLEGDFYFIKPDTINNRYDYIVKYITLFVDESFFTITGDVKDLSNALISGSKAHDEYLQLEKVLIPKRKKIDELNKNYLTAINNKQLEEKTEILKQVRDVGRNYYDIYVNWIEQHPNSVYTPYLIMNVPSLLILKNYTDIEKKGFYNKLTPYAKNSFYGIKLSKSLKLIEGCVVPDFNFVSSNGETLRLSTIVRKNKLTILDFWASWCIPCRKENTNMRSIYNVYKSKGLDIISVSVDTDTKEWKDAIEKDHLLWYQACAPTIAATSYNVKVVPTIFLLDSKGQILAKNLKGKILLDRIAELMEAD